MKNRSLAFPLVFAMAFSALACAKPTDAPSAASPKEAFGRLSIDETDAKIQEAKSGKVRLAVFDVNGKDRYAQGHLPGAKWLNKDTLASDFPADKSATLVFYCSNEQCAACHHGADAALALGYKNVFIMPAGIMGWEKAQKPVERSES